MHGAAKIRIKAPVFVIGCGRSGTAMLAKILAEHPSLIETDGYPDGEDHEGWIRHGNCVISGFGATPDINAGHTGYHYCLHMNEWDVTDEITDAMHRHYLDNVLKGNTELRVINKNPHLSNKIRYVRQIFPDAKFIHIIRDVVPVVSSWVNELKFQKHQVAYLPESDYPCLWVLPRPIDETALRVLSRENRCYPGRSLFVLGEYWRKVNINIAKQLADSPEILLTVKYEDIIDNPLPKINQCFDFLGLSKLSNLKLKVRPNNNKKHQDTLLSEDVRLLEQQSQFIRQQFNYA